MEISKLTARWTGSGYTKPRMWTGGQTIPPSFERGSFRAALAYDWTQGHEPAQEAFLIPYISEGGPLTLPVKKEGITLERIKEDLGSTLYRTGVFIDIDDRWAHDKDNSLECSDEAFFTSLEEALLPFKKFPGWFYSRTLRGARAGLIFEQPVEIDLGSKVSKEIFAQVHRSLAHLERVEVDAGSLQDFRFYTAPIGYKRNERISPEFAQLWIHQANLPLCMIEAISKKNLYESYYLKSIAGAARSAQASAPPLGRSPRGGSASADAPTRDKDTQHPRVFIERGFDRDALDGTEQYHLLRDMLWKLSHNLIQEETLFTEIAQLLDHHICNGRRQEKGELETLIKGCLNQAPAFSSDQREIGSAAPPEPATLDEFPELAPLRRTFTYPLDDLSIARSLLESMGDTPAPIWHGEGLRRYDETKGIWKLYPKAQLERILTRLEGAQAENAKGEFREISVSVNLISNAVKATAIITGAGEDIHPFDSAPAGVALRHHFVSAGLTGLKVQPHDPSNRAIHHLDYELSPQLLAYWDDEDQGHPPVQPPIFTRSFLARSLHRAPEEDETQEIIEREIKAKITTIGEWLGLALLGLCTREATALVAHGPGSNGKSVLAALITDLFGKERTAHLAPQAMKERFSRAQLFGAAVNVVSEMPESDLLESDTIKAMISGDAITVENKGEKPFRMIPRAAHFFAANTLPASRDRSHGLWRRLIPIEFHHIFTRSDRDPDLLHKLRKEYDLLVPWALDKARQYIERGGYAHEAHINSWRTSWRLETDALSGWVAVNTLQTLKADGTPLKTLWEDFKAYAESVGQSGASKMSLNAFSRALTSQPEIIKYRKRPTGAARDQAPIIHFNLKLKERSF